MLNLYSQIAPPAQRAGAGRRLLYRHGAFGASLLVSAVVLLGAGAAFGQRTQLIDDFNRANSATVGNGWTEGGGGNSSINGNMLRMTSGGTARDYVYTNIANKYQTVLASNSTTLAWAFNMQQSDTDPGGFAGGQNGVAFVLGADGNNFDTANGIAVVLGNGGGTDPLRLVTFAGGLDADANLTDILSYSDFGATFLNVRVSYSNFQWRMYLTTGASFSNPSNITTLVAGPTTDATYSSNKLDYVGGYFTYAKNIIAQFDNFHIPLGPSDIAVLGTNLNSEIVSGNITPSSTNGTDYGLVTAAYTVTNVFAITNSAAGELSISRVETSSTMGAAADFTVLSWPPVVDPGTRSNLVISFNPSASGLRTAVVAVANSDTDEGYYFFALKGTGQVATFEWDAGGGSVSRNWSNPTNWTADIEPAWSNTAYLNGGYTGVVASSGRRALTLYVGSTNMPSNGANSTGRVEQIGGDLILGNNLILGEFAGGAGTYLITNGTLTISNRLYVGDQGLGTLVLTNGGAVTVNGEAIVGNSGVGAEIPGSRLVVGGGSLTINSALRVGGDNTTNSAADGALEQYGGTIAANGVMKLADNNDSTGRVTIAGGSLSIASDLTVSENGRSIMNITGDSTTTVAGVTYISRFGDSVGILSVSGGLFAADGTLEVGDSATSATGYVAVTGGRLTSSDIIVGRQGIGTMSISGGSVTAQTLTLSYAPNGVASLTVSGGRLVTTNAGASLVLRRRASTVAVSGGTVEANGIYVGTIGAHNAATGPSTLNLSGGTIIGGRDNLSGAGSDFYIAQANSTTGLVNMTGGVLDLSRANNDLIIGQGDAALGVLTMGGGTATVAGVVQVGASGVTGSGQLYLTNGLLSVGGNLSLPYSSDQTATVAQVGGTVRVGGNLTVGNENAGGVGSYVISGGTITNSGSLLIGHASSGSGYFEVVGGAPSLQVGGNLTLASRAELRSTFNGGSLAPILVSGTITAGGTLSVTNTGLFGIGPYLIATSLSGTAVSGSFAATNWLSGQTGVVSYANNAITITMLLPIINVRGTNGALIASGDRTPESADGSDFGAVNADGNISLTHVFAITNAGTGLLTISGITTSSTMGAAADFAVLSYPATVSPGTVSNFVIRFDPAATGLRTAVVTVANNELTNSTYTFALQGTGIVPRIIVLGTNGSVLASGDVTPSPADGSDFGALLSDGAASLTNVFAITNFGSATLAISGVTTASTMGAAADFTVLSYPATVSPGTVSNFVIRFDPAATGLRTAVVTIANNDATNGSYFFALQGTGVASRIVVLGTNGAPIASDDTTPSPADGTDYGAVNADGNISLTNVFAVTNVGNATLILSAVTTSSTMGAEADFTVLAYPATVSPGTVSNLVIRFDPAATGLRTAVVTIANNDTTNGTYTFAVQGTGVVPKILLNGTNGDPIASGDATPDPADGTDYGAVLSDGSISLTHVFAITNFGDGALTISAVSTSSTMGAAADFTVLAWPAIVSPGTVSNLVIRFDPASTGLRTAVVTVANNDATNGAYAIALQGTGVAPSIVVYGTNGDLIASGDVEPSSADGTDFGALAADGNGSLTNVFTITNAGAYELTLSGVTTSSTGGAAADFTVLAYPATVSPGTASNLVIRFDPGAIGLRTALVTIANSDATNGAYAFALQGTGMAARIVVYGTNAALLASGDADPSPADGTDFGAVNADGAISLTNVFTIANEGNVTLTLSDVSTGSTMGAEADFTVLSWPDTVSPGTTSNLVIRFDPTATGLRTALVTIANSDVTNGTYTFAVQGTGIVPKILINGTNGDPLASGDVEPSPADGTDFGAVNADDAISLTNVFAITNFGTATLTISAITTSSTMGAEADFTVLAWPATVSPGTASNLVIRFDPSTTGLRTALVTVANNDATNGTYTFAVQGTGVVPRVVVYGTNAAVVASGDVTPSPADGTDYGAVLSDGSTSLTNVFAITNFGTMTLTISAVSTSSAMGAAADFTVLAWPPSVSPGTVSNLVLRFDPATTGLRTAVVTLANNDGTNGTYTFALQGTGIAPRIVVYGTNSAVVASGDVTPSPADGTDFGALLSDGSVALTNVFAITNAGTAELLVSGVSTSSDMGAAADFTILSYPATVSPGTASNLVLRFDPAASGLRTAVVTIANSDATNGTYFFAVQGTGVAPSIVVYGTNNALIASGDRAPQYTNGTDYGAVNSDGNVSLTNVFAITNAGTSVLLLSGVSTASTMGADADFQILSWPATVSPGTKSNLVIRFDPAATGLRTAVVTLASSDFTNGTYTFALQGTGVVANLFLLGTNGALIANGDVTPSPADGTDYGAANADGSISLTNVFAITNFGTGPLLLSAVTTSSTMGAAADFTVLSWPSVVSPGAVSNFVVRFDPAATGLRTAVVTVANNDAANGTYTFALQGTGVVPKILVYGTNGVVLASGDTTPSPSDGTDFGALLSDGAVALTNVLAITNFGTATLTISAVTTSSTMGAATDFTILAYPATVSPGTVSNLVVRFDPTATGLRTAVVTVANNDGTNGTYFFALQGTGIAPRIVVYGTNATSLIASGDVTPSPADGTDYGAVLADGAISLTNVFAITNAGTSVLLLSGVTTASTMGAAADFTVLSWPATVSPGTWSNLVVRFDPAATGLRTALVTIANSDATNGAYFFAVQGTGIAPSLVVYGTNATSLIASGDVTPSPADGTDYGAVLADGVVSLTNVFAITNAGTSVLLLSGVTTASTMGAAADFTVLSWPATVSPGTRSNLVVRFDPATTGLRTALVTIANNDATNGAYFFAVQGTGVAPSIVVYGTNGGLLASGDLTPSPADGTDFGAVNADGTISFTNIFTITNAGTSVLLLSGVSTSSTMGAAADFTVLSWPTSVSPGTRSNLVVRFDPAATGLRTALVTIANSDFTNGTYTFAVQGTGVVPKILLYGTNGAFIASGDRTPAIADGSDFGSVIADAAASYTNVFAITNFGTGPLTLSSVTTASTMGASADFAVLSWPTIVSPGTVSNFVIRFDPGALGLRTAVVSVVNNDATNGTYTFAVQGTGVFSRIALYGTNGTTLVASGNITPSPVAGTDYGAVLADGNVSLTNVFAVTNSGNGPLVLTGITTASTMGASADFQVLAWPSIVSPGTKSNLVIRFDPAVTGVRTAVVTIANNDATNGAYFFALKGTGVAPSIVVYGTNSTSLIASGDITPSPADGTDYGTLLVDGATSLTNVFAITNAGTSVLTLSGVTTASTMGAAADFQVLSWPATVSPGTRSNLIIRFDPAASGLRTAVVTIASSDFTNGTYFFALQGTGTFANILIKGTNGAALPSGTLTPQYTNGTDYGGVNSDGNVSLTNVFAITNMGTGPLVISGVTTASTMGASADFTVLGFPGIVSPGTVSNFLIRFDPAATGLRTAVVTVANNDATNGSYFFALQGTGVAAKILISGTNGALIASGDRTPALADGTDYGAVLSDGSVSQTNVFAITNFGTATLTISAVTTASTMGASADFTILSYPATVSPGTVSNFAIRFDPAALGLRTAVVTVVNNDATNGTYTFAVQGTGVAPRITVYGTNGTTLIASGNITPAPAAGTDYGAVISDGTVSQTNTFAVTNSGTSALFLTGVTTASTMGAAADFTILSWPSIISPGTKSNLVISFDPGAIGVRTAVVTIANSDFTNATYFFALKGTGVAPSIVVYGTNSALLASGDITPARADGSDFGAVQYDGTASQTNVFAITNAGNALLTLSGVTTASTMGAAADFTVLSWPATVSPGTRSNLLVRFDPAALGLRTAVVTIANSDYTNGTYFFAVQGTGVTPEIEVIGFDGLPIIDGYAQTLSGDGSDFGSVYVGTGTVTKTFSITNSGSGNLTISGVTTSGPHASDFTVLSFPSIVSPLSISNLTVRFTPGATGIRTGFLAIANNDFTESSYDFSVHGAGLTAPILQDTDLPNPATNLEVIAAGSLIIPMDTNSQSIVAPFNLRAYGLVMNLLRTNVAVKWAINTSKVQDGADFTGYVARILPSAVAVTSRVFRGGPFIIPAAYTGTAAAVVNGWSNNVAVYRLLSNMTADIRYTLNNRPKIAVMNDGGNTTSIQYGVLSDAGITNGIDFFSAAKLAATSCYTCATEPHYGSTSPTGQVAGVTAFVQSGGNFLAQCAGVETYEDFPTAGRYHSTQGITVDNLTESFTYRTPNLALAQFQGALDSAVGGSVVDWYLPTGSSFTNNAHAEVQCVTTTNHMQVAAAKLYSGTRGSVIAYLGGHDYTKNSTLAAYNGERVYLNMLFIPATRPSSCDLSFGADLGITKTDNATVVLAGATNTYIIVVTNNGPTAVTNATVADAFPSGLTSVTWTATAQNGASLTNTSGSGDISLQATLPVGGWLVITARASVVLGGAYCAITNTATVATPTSTVDPTPGNDSATDVDNLAAATLVGQVRLDIDGDMDFTDPDSGMTNVPIRLWTDPNGDGDVADGTIVSVRVTDVTGYFAFTNITAGYFVVQQSVPTGFGAMVASDGGTDTYISVTTTCGGSSLLTNFIYLDSVLADITGWVRNDVDADGDFGDTDSGIAGVAVAVYTDPNEDGDPSDGVLKSNTVTDASGNYIISSLLPGHYVVVETDKSGWMSTADSEGANDNRVTIIMPGGINYTAYFLDTTISGLAITKEAQTLDDFDIGQNATYTISVTNNRTSTQTLVQVSDTLPSALGYKANSTWVIAYAGNLLDMFNGVAYSNNDGTARWTTNWFEEGDDNNVAAGDIRVITNALQLKNKNNSIRRNADLSGYGRAVLSMSYRITSFDNASDAVRLEIAAGNTNSYVLLNAWTGPIASQTGTVSYDISAYLSTNTIIHFTNSAAMAADDIDTFDDIRIDVWTSQTGGPPPFLAEGYTVLPGGTLTITFTASVDEVDDIINEACLTTATTPTNPLCSSTSNGVSEIALTNGLRILTSETNGLQIDWSVGVTGPVSRAYDILYVDNDSPGFSPALTSGWAWADTVTNSSYVDTGGYARVSPTVLSNQMRFYRIARQGRWPTNVMPRHATKEVYVAKNIRLSEGENWVSLFMVPDRNRLASVFGTNTLPAGDQMSRSTVIEWYGATKTGGATNTVWLSSAGTWMKAQGGIADDQQIPLNEGFNITIPAGSNTQNLLVIGKVPTNSSVENGLIQTLRGSGTFNIVSCNLPHRCMLKDSCLKQAGFRGPSSGTPNPNNSDELRILQRGGGSFASPKYRIIMNSSTQFIYWTGGSGSAENHRLDVDDTLIIYTKRSISNLNWNMTMPYPEPTVNINP